MHPSRWQEIEEIYYSILDAPAGDRHDLLDRACRGDAELRSEIESLLQCDDRVGEFLSPKKLGGHIAGIGSAAEAPGVGSEVVPYRFLPATGAGARGEVYLGRDPRLDRQ